MLSFVIILHDRIFVKSDVGFFSDIFAIFSKKTVKWITVNTQRILLRYFNGEIPLTFLKKRLNA